MAEKALLGLLKEAIDMEKRGQKFYSDMSRKCTNEITGKTFAFLAENEAKHIESIKNFYETMRKEGKFPSFNLESDRGERKEALRIFSKNIKNLAEKIKPDENDLEACQFAMDFENNGYRYYKDMLGKTKDGNLVELLKFLLDEESAHYEGIKDLHTYLADSKNWYMYEEESFPQGG
ncbi:MAG: ferritin family protein [Candidatus Omnitrophica bacterium]|nr:ferritin family protein [Candidatus Omnitrophota bacterium]